MAEDSDEMAVLLQQAISEMRESQKQTKALLEQNAQLAEQNTLLAEKMKEAVEGNSRRSHAKSPQVKVAVYTKV